MGCFKLPFSLSFSGCLPSSPIAVAGEELLGIQESARVGEE